MDFLWHQIFSKKLGQFSPDNSQIVLDYAGLFLDSQKAELTYFHEISHAILSGTTEHGHATERIYQLLPYLKSISNDEKNRIIAILRDGQIFTQEGGATLMQLIMLRKKIGPKETISWAEQNLPNQYYKWVEPLLFVLDMSEKHRNIFTKKIPHIAMHMASRKVVYEQGLLTNIDSFVKYFSEDENRPDYRFGKLIDAVKKDRFLVLKEPKEICEKAGINNFGDVSKEDVVNFVNYTLGLAGVEEVITVEQIKTPAEQEEIVKKRINENIIVGNLNLNLSDTAIFLPKIEDILHYKDEIEVVFINFLREDVEWKLFFEKFYNKKIDLGGFLVCRDGSKYTVALSRSEAIKLINEDLVDKSFFVKWGIYEFGQPGIGLIKEMRRPNIVIYNTINDLTNKLKTWKGFEKMKILHFGATEDGLMQGVVIKDELNVLHVVNSLGNKKISDLIAAFKIPQMEIRELEPFKRHLNNTLSLWMGLDWKIDWFKSSGGDVLFFR